MKFTLNIATDAAMRAGTPSPCKERGQGVRFYRGLLPIFFLLISFLSFPQTTTIDSLENLLKTVKEDTNKVNIILQISDICTKENELEYLNQALQLSEKIGFKKGIAKSLNDIGLIQWEKGIYDKALEYYFKSLKIYEEIGNKHGLAASYNNIGLIQADKGDYDKALEFYFKALKLNKENKNKIWAANNLNNIGVIYKNKTEYDKAIEFYLEALKIREEINDKRGIVSSYGNIGTIYMNKGDYNMALEFYFNALKIVQEIGDQQKRVICYINIGSVYSLQKKYSDALVYINKSLELAKKIELKEAIKECYNVLSDIYEKMQNHKLAYHYHQLYSQYKDSLLNEESSKQIAEMQTKYETEKKELQIENLNKDNTIKETEIKKQNIQKLAFASGFGLMLILAFVIFRGYRQKQKANEIISAQKTEVEKQKYLVDEKNKSLEVAYKHIEEKNTEILDSIRYAKRIQEAILPPQKLVKQYLENSFILYKPKDIVAGDFYWIAPLNPPEGGSTNAQAGSIAHSNSPLRGVGGLLLFACCDCTGHGVPGAFMSIVAHNALNRAVKEFGLTEPAKILDKVTELVEDTFSKSETDIKDGMDIALCALAPPLPEERGQGGEAMMRLSYAGAGNSLYHIHNGILKEYKADKQPIGKFSNRKPFTNHTIELPAPLNPPEGGTANTQWVFERDSGQHIQAGSKIPPLGGLRGAQLPPSGGGGAIYIFTDGYADQFGGPKGKKFKYSQFENLLLSIQDKSMTEQREILNTTIDEWKGTLEQIDDICIIGVRV